MRLGLCLGCALALAGCRHALPAKVEDCTPVAGAGCLTVTGAPGVLVLHNQSHAKICRVHLRPASGDDWSEPIDDATPIPEGYSLEYHVAAHAWDVKAMDCAGGVKVQRVGVPLTNAGATLTLTE
jgi:hypothetical protein